MPDRGILSGQRWAWHGYEKILNKKSPREKKSKKLEENIPVLGTWNMEGVAKYDFRANQEDEISFRTNDVLKILQLDEVFLIIVIRKKNKKIKDKNWFRAELNGQIGYVPKNRVELKVRPVTSRTNQIA